MSEFKNKVALITGASGAIGKDIASTLNKSGAAVILCGTKIDVLEDIASDLSGEVEIITENIKNFEKFEKSLLEKKLNVDILVNNAGITKDNLLMRMSEDDFQKVIKVNLNSVFNMTKACLRHFLKNRQGSIINMSSVVGVKGNAGQSNYAASKSGIIGFSKSIALELGSRNIRCNVIAPGFIVTEMTDKLSESVTEDWIKNIPLRRSGNPGDVANLCVFFGIRFVIVYNRSSHQCRWRTINLK